MPAASRDSLEWLEMMAVYGPRDCQPMFSQVAEEIKSLREENVILIQALEDARTELAEKKGE